MSYVALYRKFRPQEFSDVKGQEHIVTTLKNEIAADRIGHAYLFTGTRGTGKTTVAKIFARAVNCQHPLEDGSPCGECEVCKAIGDGSSLNVVEMDAASNNGVESIRSIIEDVGYPPTVGKYKVYIIDEVHMLSAAAFNAFLKTLEEPPSYVIFILATTELHKIPVTILSRCQRYDFHRIQVETIAARLRELCEAEQVEAEDEALDYVARAGDGSMRDALSLLDQCINFYLGQKLTYDNVLKVLGVVDTQVFSKLMRGIQDREVQTVLSVVEDVVNTGRDLAQFVTDFTWYLRNMLLVSTDETMLRSLDMTSENKALLLEESKKTDTVILMRYIRILSELSNQIRMSMEKRVLLEVALIRLCHPQMDEDNGAMIERMEDLERRQEEAAAITPEMLASLVQRAGSQQPSSTPVIEKPPMPKATPEDIGRAVGNFDSMVARLEDKALQTYLSGSQVNVRPSEDGQTLWVVFDNELSYNMVNGSANQALLRQMLLDGVGAEVPYELILNTTNVPGRQAYGDAREDFFQQFGFEVEIEDNQEE
ncbi:MAG: DNA polymerase III subunit gamma/tau [Candidatus Weimeria sp.]|nr:DNA polymerase III subunit gamma/tau [Lachnospiraceae bacterium]MEE3355154.1 DNA polymerase III subunit gamma/tau [Candidatus Weimeria sp.]